MIFVFFIYGSLFIAAKNSNPIAKISRPAEEHEMLLIVSRGF
jgi:hypothetical protein